MLRDGGWHADQVKSACTAMVRKQARISLARHLIQLIRNLSSYTPRSITKDASRCLLLTRLRTTRLCPSFWEQEKMHGPRSDLP